MMGETEVSMTKGARDGTAMRAPRAISAIRVVLAALLLAGCASVPPTRVTSVDELAGNWQGTITQGFNGPQQLYYLTIHPDGGMVAQWGPNWQWGEVTVNGVPRPSRCPTSRVGP